MQTSRRGKHAAALTWYSYKMFRPISILIIFATLVTPAFAWIDTGHMVVTEIARRELNELAKHRIETLIAIGGSEKTNDFVTASCWADDFKTAENGPWHYINIHFRNDDQPVTNKALEQNVIWAIEKFSKEINDPFLDNARKADALRFLLHFVGDVHQPMHSVACDNEAHPDGDRGGNDFTFEPFELAGFTVKNLHFLWDIGGGLYGKTDRPLVASNNIGTLATQLINENPRSSFLAINNQKPVDWAEESFKLARGIAYDLPTTKKPSDAYLKTAQYVSSRRITIAGYRLADLLNRLLGQ
ncbi:MAG: S1/P1 nuclease [Fimbriimonadaceae bacterium]